MKTRGVCPTCGHVGTLDQFVDEADAKQYCKLVGELQPPIARALFDYLRLFSPPKRALSWARALRLSREIHAAIERGYIERKSRTWATPMPVWEPALRKVIDKQASLSLPLKDNAYLFEILASEANRGESQAEKERESARRHRADQRRHIATSATPNTLGSASAPIPGGSLKAAVAAQTERLRSQSQSNDEDHHD